MEKNDILRLSEALYQLHACQNPDTLRETLLSQLRLVIPHSYASLMDIAIDSQGKSLSFHRLLCVPDAFTQAEQAWIQEADKSSLAWIARAPETKVLRQSDVLTCPNWFRSPLYQALYQPYGICDMLLMNLTYQSQPMALLCLFRTKAEGAFTAGDEFLCQLFSSHINLVYHRALQQSGSPHPLPLHRRDLGLTQRETEILELIFQDWNNEELLSHLKVTPNTLRKHLQNLYRKCGVSSRLDLLKLRDRLE